MSRYGNLLCCRHYTDVVLVAVVALCTLENDVIHAAYLAIALLLFRRRDVLRAERQALFRWLPLYNFAVMLLTLLYQSPFEDIWGHSLAPSLVRHFLSCMHACINRDHERNTVLRKRPCAHNCNSSLGS